jgi:hypothetical protein
MHSFCFFVRGITVSGLGKDSSCKLNTGQPIYSLTKRNFSVFLEELFHSRSYEAQILTFKLLFHEANERRVFPMLQNLHPYINFFLHSNLCWISF